MIKRRTSENGRGRHYDVVDAYEQTYVPTVNVNFALNEAWGCGRHRRIVALLPAPPPTTGRPQALVKALEGDLDDDDRRIVGIVILIIVTAHGRSMALSHMDPTKLALADAFLDDKILNGPWLPRLLLLLERRWTAVVLVTTAGGRDDSGNQGLGRPRTLGVPFHVRDIVVVVMVLVGVGGVGGMASSSSALLLENDHDDRSVLVFYETTRGKDE